MKPILRFFAFIVAGIVMITLWHIVMFAVSDGVVDVWGGLISGFQQLLSYREIRDDIAKRVKKRFSK